MSVGVQGSKDLLKVVQEKCEELGVQAKTSTLEEKLTEEEASLVEKMSFPKELQFSVPVNLALSKKAFHSVLSGLNQEVACFDDLLKLRAHDARLDYYPMGPVEMDLSFLLKDSAAK